MTESKNKTARFIAAQVLGQFDPERNYAGPILDRLLDQTQQRQRATDLVFGMIRNLIAIDKVIDTFAGCPIERIQKKLLNIIRIGCYELIYSPSTQQYSIINEAAENAKVIAGTKQVGFVNALLRKITRHIKNRQIELSQAGARRTLVQDAESGCEFDTDFLPDFETESAEFLSIVFSLPIWLVTDWLDEFGKEKTRQICLAQNRRPSIYIRPNSLKTTAQELIEKFEKEPCTRRGAGEGIELELIQNVTPTQAGVQNKNTNNNRSSMDSCFHRNDSMGEYMLRIKSPRAVTQLPGFEEGLFMVQDLTASQPIGLLAPRSGWTILDLCAAPGVKTTQLAEVTGDTARIIATDIDTERLKKVKENSDRLGINRIEVVPYKQLPNIKFDCILLDVPCSNTGVLARRIEARYRIRPDAITELAKTQYELLEKAAGLLKPQGKICYSTCSIQKQENGELIRKFLDKYPGFTLELEQLMLPSADGFDRDGGYTVILSRL
jgi:16S rRNA (cytosine967-C5)-methyltransferase